ncbi:MAG: hypothetical protein AAGK47_09300 [Bacteroidota bacterium]
MKRLFLLCMSVCMCAVIVGAQGGSAFGIKLGPSVGTQSWNSFERDPLFAYHVAAYVETYEEEAPFAIFAQLGYHVRGSALRGRLFTNIGNGQLFSLPTQEFRFNNIALILGGKRKYAYGTGFNQLYYMFGVRGAYTVSTNLEAFAQFNQANPASAIYPFPEGVQRFNYGVSIGGGFEFMFQELVGGFVELSIHPDFSRQYEQPPLNNIVDPYTGERRSIPERIVRNLSLDISVGIRLIRKVVYID